MTGTGLKKWSPVDALSTAHYDTPRHSPTTRPALFLPSSLAALTLLGRAEAAIFVMLIELVFEARIASGLSSAANDANIDCLRGKDSETACMTSIPDYNA